MHFPAFDNLVFLLSAAISGYSYGAGMGHVLPPELARDPTGMAHLASLSGLSAGSLPYARAAAMVS